MSYEIELLEVAARPIAAVAATVPRGQIPRALIECLDKVYALLRTRQIAGLGCNIAVYREGPAGAVAMLAGVETPEAIEGEGEVIGAATPTGRAAMATHWGPYDRLGEAYAALGSWLAARGLVCHVRWEVYGDWSDDPAKLRTDVFHLIEPESMHD